MEILKSILALRFISTKTAKFMHIQSSRYHLQSAYWQAFQTFVPSLRSVWFWAGAGGTRKGQTFDFQRCSEKFKSALHLLCPHNALISILTLVTVRILISIDLPSVVHAPSYRSAFLELISRSINSLELILVSWNRYTERRAIPSLIESY